MVHTFRYQVLQCAGKLRLISGSGGGGGGVSGRMMAFCWGRPVLNPRMDLGFFQFRNAINLFPLGVRLFLITSNIMVVTLPSSLLFPIVI